MNPVAPKLELVFGPLSPGVGTSFFGFLVGLFLVGDGLWNGIFRKY